jgi:S-adenosylmethionine/arginine decarboxylase-like enzyme
VICATYDLIDCATPEPEPHELLQPHGITCVLVLAESHLVVSTWPEHQFAHIDLFTCRADTDPEHALQPIIEVLGSRKVHGQRIHRVTPTSFSSETSQVSPSSAVAFDRRTGCAPS